MLKTRALDLKVKKNKLNIIYKIYDSNIFKTILYNNNNPNNNKSIKHTQKNPIINLVNIQIKFEVLEM